MDESGAFESALRERLERASVKWNGTVPERRAETASARRDDIDLAPFYTLLRSEALIFRDFRSTASLSWRLDMRRDIRRPSLAADGGGS